IQVPAQRSGVGSAQKPGFILTACGRASAADDPREVLAAILGRSLVPEMTALLQDLANFPCTYHSLVLGLRSGSCSPHCSSVLSCIRSSGGGECSHAPIPGLPYSLTVHPGPAGSGRLSAGLRRLPTYSDRGTTPIVAPPDGVDRVELGHLPLELRIWRQAGRSPSAFLLEQVEAIGRAGHGKGVHALLEPLAQHRQALSCHSAPRPLQVVDSGRQC